jgi:hypothetical protein
MTIITEDTPEGGPDDQHWRIDGLTDQLKQVKDELEKKRQVNNGLVVKLNEAQDRYDDLTSRLTVGTLRKAGYTVVIKQPEGCEACGEDD